MMFPIQSRMCVAMFGVGLYCGLLISDQRYFHNITVAIVGTVVFYFTSKLVGGVQKSMGHRG